MAESTDCINKKQLAVGARRGAGQLKVVLARSLAGGCGESESGGGVRESEGELAHVVVVVARTSSASQPASQPIVHAQAVGAAWAS